MNGLFAFGAAIGAIVRGWTADIGRKKALYGAASAALVGAALTAGSVNIPMLIIVRILMGFGLGMIICLVPLYITEVSPPHRRGVMVGMTGMSLGTGYLV